MTTRTIATTTIRSGLDARLLGRMLEEGYGPGAWHGPDLHAALDDVAADAAYWRPAPGRHNIAEIALHHAFYVRAVRGQLSGTTPEPFVLEGEDWFTLSEQSDLTWLEIKTAVAEEQRRLASLIADVEAGRVQPAPTEAKRFDLVLGITCHAVYHAGQVQLLKRLLTG